MTILSDPHPPLLALRQPVRTVSPVPPYEADPLPDEPFVPAYDFIPLPAYSDGFAGGGAAVAALTDPLVFGEWHPAPDYGSMSVRCPRCDVKWAETAGDTCWHCGRLR